MNTTSPLDCPAWKALEGLAGVAFKRHPDFVLEAAGVRFDYSRQRITGDILEALARLSSERGFAEWRKALFAGGKINTSENRAALHTALRAGQDAPNEVKEVLEHLFSLSDRIRSENRFKRIINLGTGGSDLGPRLLADAFSDGALDVRFVANIDPVELGRALEGADPASTLGVVVSKTFTTAETMQNAQALRNWGCRNFVAVTTNLEAAKAFKPLVTFPMWDWVGGRYSVWSAVSFSAVCSIGVDPFRDFLTGGKDMDSHFEKSEILKNIPALMALLGVWNTNFLGSRAHAVLPYAHRLRLLPAYLQQLEMESNGKNVDRNGKPAAYATAPVLFGAEGTCSQHSFHQLLHQGSAAVPADFVDCAISRELSANATAQADALAEHGRPSSMLGVSGDDARNLGRLIALYEHKVFTQGVLWNINSFDQPGVELGKRLAQKILKGEK
ncbi:MAG TPA: glucose-6-phosphate isomerase [Burkholderiales bacterium]|nr:glucose-6-phosphate isomerase [Burkholderiales bacterium]